MRFIYNSYLYHIGMPRRSGRYPFGSGKRPFQGVSDKSYKQAKQTTKALDEGVKTGRTLLKMYDRAKSKKNRKKYDLSEMSDKELQQAINRMNLEQNYTRLKNNQETVSRGYEWVKDTLDNVGDAVAIGGSIATIAWTIHQLRK